VLVGDVRQHQAVDAGRPYEQLQQAGMQTARLDEILRQKDPALKETVERLARGEVRDAIARLDSGRELSLNIDEHPHLDYGYAVSHSSQGATADRVLIHIDSETAHAQLINSRLAYVSVSRACYDAHIYTNDAGALDKVLSREVSHAAAVEHIPGETQHAGLGAGASDTQEPTPAVEESAGQALSMEH
jgi:ATP-dependent exoDNAse (exonuclease V) alpha subunit